MSAIERDPLPQLTPASRWSPVVNDSDRPATTPSASDHLRRLLRRHASTVVVVTATGAGGPVGLTVTSFTSVSLRPPLVSFCHFNGSSSWPVVSVAEYVAVHILAAHQAGVARIFATAGVDRFARTGWRPGPYGLPLLDGTLAWLACRVTARIAAGDHTIVLGAPVAAEYADGAPLLYHDGRYAFLPGQ